MNRKKSQSQKSRRRKTATKPSGVSSKKATKGSVPPSKRRSAKREKAFLEQVEKIYLADSKRHIDGLRGMGVRDPEAAYHDALFTILDACSGGIRKLAYLPNRLKCRVLTSQKAHYRYQNREVAVSDEDWSGIVANDAPSSAHDLAVELDYLFERLDADSAQILRWFYLDHRSIDEISALTDRPKNTIKSDLRRSRRKARKILIEFRLKEDAACNRRSSKKG